jgi:hypothetical protein
MVKVVFSPQSILFILFNLSPFLQSLLPVCAVAA